MDRFNGSESVSYIKRFFNDGVSARRAEQPMINPNFDASRHWTSFERQSWIAGWVDEDMVILSENVTDPVDDGSCDPLYGSRMDDADLGRN